ncbi:vacuolar protein sorting-associated protein 45 [Balamuthia mandrillaris]
MNVVQAIQDYITKMVESVSGMKVLVMDKETTGIVSLVYSQSQMLQKEVYLFERLDNQARELMAHLKAICFLRPTEENCRMLDAELKRPRYGEYHIFFTNVISSNFLEELAEADEHEVVQQVQEFFGDFYANTPELFSLNIEHCMALSNKKKVQMLERTCDGLMAVLLSLKKKPVIRYQKKSDLAQRVGQEVARRMQQEKSLFDFRKSDTAPLLLILDRRDDPVTPLLHQWTYQAMVHELLGIYNNRVDLKNVPGIRKELEEVVLSSDQDSFYKSNMYNNFGDLGISIKNLVDEFQSKTQSNQNIQSIADMKRFVEEYPEFRKLSGNVSKHVAVMGELSRIVEFRSLLDVSELEQELACHQDHAAAVKKLSSMLENPKITKEDCLKLVMLYALRYEENSSNKITQFIEKLFDCGLDEDQVGLISALTAYAGASQRSGDLFGNSNLLRIARSSIRRGLKGIDNIYTEHQPLLRDILESVMAGRMREADYPYIIGSPSKERPENVIVFIVGGATYEEAFTVHQMNKDTTYGCSIILGGTTIHNSKSFFAELAQIRDLNQKSYSGKRNL